MSNTGPNPPFERLLAHTEWLRRLARSLLSDPGEVDDIVQETWVAALEHSGGEIRVRDERAWLGGVFRNVMRQTKRTRGRARRREGEAARSEALPATGDLVGQADLQIRVLQAAVALNEPYRSTLLMHYFEGLSAEDIGQRLGVPASTVRNRHKRALELLRERFDREHGGDRTAWCLLMIPIAIPRGAGAAATALTAATTAATIAASKGVWTMSMQVLAVSASIALIGWGSSVVLGTGGGSEASAPRTGENALVAALEPASGDGAEVALEAAVTVPDAAPQARANGQQGQERRPVPVGASVEHVLRGRVLDTEGRPVADARVFVGGRPSPWDGEVKAGLELLVESEQRERDMQKVKHNAELRKRKEQAHKEGGNVERPEESHAEEPHAEKPHEQEAHAKAERHERANREQQEALRKKANAKLAHMRELEEELHLHDVQLDLDRLQTLERPLRGLKEWARVDASRLEARGAVLGQHLVTDSEGRFELDFAHQTKLFVTFSPRPGLRMTHLGAWHTTPAEEIVLTVQRVPTASVAVWLTDRVSGERIERWIGVIERNGHPLMDWEAEGRVERTLEFPLDGPAEFSVSVREPAWARQSVALDLVPGAHREIEILVDPGLGLRGSVVDALGRPLEGAFVYWGVALDMRGKSIFGSHNPEHVFDGVETDMDGVFHLPGSAEWVTVWHREYSPATVKPAQAGTVQLVARGGITGSIPPEWLEKIDLARRKELHVRREGNVLKAAPSMLLDRRIRGPLDEFGAFSFEGVEAGVHAIALGERWFTGVVVQPGRTTHVDLDGGRTGAKVEVLAGGQPFERAFHGTFTGLDGVFTLGEMRTAKSGGVFGVEGQRLGSYVLYTDRQQIGTFELTGSRRATVDLGDADLTIQGTPDSLVFLVPEGMVGNPIVERVASLYPGQIPASGTLLLEPLPVGRYAIYDPSEGIVAHADVRGPGASVVLP